MAAAGAPEAKTPSTCEYGGGEGWGISEAEGILVEVKGAAAQSARGARERVEKGAGRGVASRVLAWHG